MLESATDYTARFRPRLEAELAALRGMATERRRQVRIEAILAALDRMDRGVYGECTHCDEQVGEHRLEHDPAVMRCLSCTRRKAK